MEQAPPKQTPGDALHLTTKTVRSHSRRRTYDLSQVPDAVKLINPLPEPGETIHALMGGDFAAWDLIPAIHQLLNVPITELYITTLGFNFSNNGHLCAMLDQGHVQKTWILCSTYFKAADPDVFHAAEENLKARGCFIKAVRNHTKIIAIAPKGSQHRYVIESSANLRSCNNIEQFTLTNSPEVFNFHKGWITAQFP